ncbi:MAG TPA: hypothetical protein VHP37_15610 [Burkholderiales bacterium]|nr:hypothetical protein [Burkholderiales bacterium]
MGKRKEGSMTVAAALAFGGWAAVAAAQMSGPQVPDALTPPVGHKHADGSKVSGKQLAVAPELPRDGGAVNTETTVKYSADYVFYKP